MTKNELTREVEEKVVEFLHTHSINSKTDTPDTIQRALTDEIVEYITENFVPNERIR